MWRTVWSWGVGFLTTLVFGVGAMLTSWIPPRGKLYCHWARAWARTTLRWVFIPVTIERDPSVPPLPAAVFMANHESLLDILSLFLAVEHDVRFLAKRTLFYIPVLGWSMWLAGFIPVDRERKDRARDVWGDLATKVKAGCSVLVFPEGTRSRTGGLGEFKKSGFLLAIKTGLPIVPIGITGARDILGADGITLKKGAIAIRIGAPIPTAGLGVSHRAELMDRVRAEMLRLTSRPD